VSIDVKTDFKIQQLPSEGNEFFISATSEDASGCEELLAAASGKSHYLTRILIRTDSATDLTIGSGETNSAPTVVHIGTVPLNAASGFFMWKAPDGKGLRFNSGLSMTIKASAGTIYIYAEGRTCRDNL